MAYVSIEYKNELLGDSTHDRERNIAMTTAALSIVFVAVTIIAASASSCSVLRDTTKIGSPVVLYGSGCRCADFVPPKCDCDSNRGNGGDNGGNDKRPPTPPPPPPICPPHTNGEMWQVRHETNCRLYYECTDGKKVQKDCGDGMAFNVDLELCDITENVDCKNRDHYPCE